MNEKIDMASRGKPSVVSEVFDWVESAITALLFMVIVFTFVGMNITVNGASMSPTLKDGQRLVCSRLFMEPKYKDIVVVTNPRLEHNPLIKRVIAVGGQTIDFDAEANRVTIDGKPIEEPYIREEMKAYSMSNRDMYPLTVPEGHVFVMGDNRNDSWDSRIPAVGPVDERYIFGRVVYRFYPYDKMGVPK